MAREAFAAYRLANGRDTLTVVEHDEVEARKNSQKWRHAARSLTQSSSTRQAEVLAKSRQSPTVLTVNRSSGDPQIAMKRS